MPTKISQKQLQEIEKYDYLRSEYFQKGGNRPYTPRPLTQFEKNVIRFSFIIELSDKIRSYADVSTEDLGEIIWKCSEKRFAPAIMSLKGIIDKTEKNYSEDDVKKFLEELYRIYILQDLEKTKVFRVTKEIEDSILSVFSQSDYYKNHKKELEVEFKKDYKIDLKECYFDKSDVLLFYATLLRSIPQNAQEELDI